MGVGESSEPWGFKSPCLSSSLCFTPVGQQLLRCHACLPAAVPPALMVPDAISTTVSQSSMKSCLNEMPSFKSCRGHSASPQQQQTSH